MSETIYRPKQVVFDYERKLDNQKHYSLWVMADPDMKPEIAETYGTVGAKQIWKSKIDDIGEGEQKISSITPDRMNIDVRFNRSYKGTAEEANIFKAISDNQTTLNGGFYSNYSYPFNLPSYLFGRKMLKESQATNLQNTKQILEQKMSNSDNE